MTSHWAWLVGGVNAVAASVLVVAATAKLAAPRQSLLALRELFGSRSERLTAHGVRAFAVVEVAAAVALLVAGTRTAGALLVAALGACFASLGLLGRVRRSRVACGCFGRAGGRPLGLSNAAMGLALVLAAPLNLSIDVSAATAHDYSRAALIGAALGSLAFCLWVQRRVVLTLRRPIGSPAKEATS